MSQSDDMQAIYNQVNRTLPATSAGSKAKSEFLNWYVNLGWYDKNLNSATYDEARQRRNKFNLDNAATQAQKENVQRVLATGLTTEDMQATPTIKSIAGKPVTMTTTTTSLGPKSTIRQGSKGPDVVTWQKIIGVTADGNFGPGTAAATKKWQSAHGLTADGIVGKNTWSKAAPPSTTTSTMDTSDFRPASEVLKDVPAVQASSPGRTVYVAPKASVSAPRTPVQKAAVAAVATMKKKAAAKKPTVKAAASVSKVSPEPKIAEAGMVPTGLVESFKKAPTWVKAATALILVAFGYVGYQEYKKKEAHKPKQLNA